MKKLFALVLALALMCSAAAFAETFKMGIDAEYPPYTYIGDDGNYAGFDIEVCTAVCEKLGMDLEIVPINWDTKLISLDAGEIDCVWSGLTLNYIDTAKYTVSEPYCDSVQKILTKKGNGIETMDDLAGKIVAVQAGTSAEDMLQDSRADLAATFGELQAFPDYNTCFTELMAGAVDAIAIDESIANSKIASYGDEYFTLEEDLDSEVYGICFRLDDTALCESIMGAFKELAADGVVMEIAQKYAEGGLDVDALTIK